MPNLPTIIPMAIQASQNQPIKFNIEHVISPVEMDFTAEIQMLPIGSDPSVHYSRQHFNFQLPYGDVPIIPLSTIRAIVEQIYEEEEEEE